MKYKAIIFDFDNTISNTFDGVAELLTWSINQVLDKSKHVSFDFVRNQLNQYSTFEDCLAVMAANLEIDKYAVLEIYRSNSERVKYSSCSGFFEFFKYIKQQQHDIKCILVTNRMNLLDLRLNDCGLSQNDFDFVIQPSNVSEKKPSSFMMDRVVEFLSEYNIDSNAFLSIGDNIIDYQAGLMLRFKFYAVLGGSSTRDEFLKVGVSRDCIFENLLEVFNDFKKN